MGQKKKYNIHKLTPAEKKEATFLSNHKKQSKVTPKMERFRGFPVTFMGARGGRGAGAKTRGFINLIVQEAHREKHSYVMLREIQKSIQDSLFKAIEEQVERLMYTGWEFIKTTITAPSGSKFVFRGLKDLRAANAIKGLENFDRIFLDEAAHISETSITKMLPTILRNDGPKVMFAYNPEEDCDPITKLIWDAYSDMPEDALLIDMLPGAADNPWWPEGLEKQSAKMKMDDPDLWEHVYGGKPQKQGARSIIGRVDCRAAAERDIELEGAVQVGIDVARFGDDETVIYKRRGLKVIERKSWRGQDTVQSANEAWAMANHDPSVMIVVDDTGVGAGVSDKLTELGAKIYRFIAGGKAANSDKYVNATAEMWHEFPVDVADIPDDPELIRQLSGRQYSYDKKGRRRAEPKADYKKRIGKSPDDADALLLCFLDTHAVSFDYVVR